MGHKGPENTRKDESPRQSTVAKRHTESKASRSPEQIPPQNQRSFHRLQRVKTDKAKNKSGDLRCPSRWRCHGQSRSISEPLGLPALTPGASVSASRRMARALPIEQTQSCGEPPYPVLRADHHLCRRPPRGPVRRITAWASAGGNDRREKGKMCLLLKRMSFNAYVLFYAWFKIKLLSLTYSFENLTTG